MSTGIPAWEIEISGSSAWIDDLLARLGWHDRKPAHEALKATLPGLRDHVDVEAVALLAQALPALLQGDFFDGWRPGDRPLTLASRDDVLDRVHEAVHRNLVVDPEPVVRAVFALLRDRLAASELEEVKAISLAARRGFWPV
jgi:uncharacterized protein (DUF2267 family)